MKSNEQKLKGFSEKAYICSLNSKIPPEICRKILLSTDSECISVTSQRATTQELLCSCQEEADAKLVLRAYTYFENSPRCY